ncbi:ATP-binding protein [Pelobacter propionicus]|uniref:histidine kinase n=1 Tax=Pelobacter propionicus (strain DSM 2379 / NBRC 103807 / OttBd1) TaxID=338966 RepID=A1ATS9_PELPD|nr:ATP-binding protein [Pelobacter propionicus]ABL00750.1 PAS/PAC sensor signal transduction histidine kinase [Pelobacter propionicus DSM 2379]
MTFRWKLMLSYLLLILLLSGSYYLSFDHSAQSYFLDESRENLISQTRLAKLLAEQERDTMPPQQLAERIGSAIKARVTLIDRSGLVRGDSDVSKVELSHLENHLKRPEVVQAMQGGIGSSLRYSETLKTDMLYTALGYESNGHYGFIRLSLPLERLSSATAALHRMTAGSVGMALLAALAFSLLLSRVTSRPLREMAEVAARIGRDGEYSRIPVASQDEIGALASVLNDMAERIDAQMHGLDAEKTRLDAILRGMGEGVMVASADGAITLVNPAFRKMFAMTDGVEGKKLIEVCRNPDLQAAFHDLARCGGELSREIRIQPGDVTLLTHWVPLAMDGAGQGVVAVFHDITDMKHVEEMRRDFVANVSHELRTPVSVIKGYAETLMQNDMLVSEPEHATRFVEIIRRHAERLTTLINDILTLSCLEARNSALELNAMDVGTTIAKSCALLAPRAAEKKICLHNEVGNNLPRTLVDQGRLEQVLVNLIDNAVKYTPEGGTIRLFAEQGETFLRISVQDSGIGIPPRDLPRIFERFYRVDEGRSREQGGTGLGLAIAKHIVQLHGGELTVTSTPGKGSTFSFTLRMATNS